MWSKTLKRRCCDEFVNHRLLHGAVKSHRVFLHVLSISTCHVTIGREDSFVALHIPALAIRHPAPVRMVGKEVTRHQSASSPPNSPRSTTARIVNEQTPSPLLKRIPFISS